MSGSSFDDLKISYSSDLLSSTHGYLIVSIPVSAPITTGDYGIHVIYQYTNPFNKGELVIDNDNSFLQLIGSNEIKVEQASEYTEPGWRVYKNNAWVNNDTAVTVSYSHDSNAVTGIQATGTTIITYTYISEAGGTYIQ